MITKIYTDASHKDGVLVYAAWIVSSLGQYGISGECNTSITKIHQAEMYAIYRAIWHANRTWPASKVFTVHTDCQSAINRFAGKVSVLKGSTEATMTKLVGSICSIDKNAPVKRLIINHVKGHTKRRDQASIFNKKCDRECKRVLNSVLMRNAKREATHEVNLLYPLDMTQIEIKEDDCFAKEWDPNTKECGGCADTTVCGIMFQKQVKKPVKAKLEKKDGPYLDQTYFLTTVDLDKVETIIKEAFEDNEPVTVEEMQEYFMLRMKSRDEMLVVSEMRKFILSREHIAVRSGTFIYKA